MDALVLEQLITFAAALLSLLCILLLIRQPDSNEMKLATTYSIFSFITCMGYLGILYSGNSILLLLYSVKVKYFGALALFTTMTGYMHYVNIKVPRFIRGLAYALFVFIMLMVLAVGTPAVPVITDPSSYLSFMRFWFFKSYFPATTKGVPYLYKVNAWGHTLFIFCSAAYIITLLFAYIRSMVKKQFVDKVNLTLLTVVLAIPVFCYLLEKIVSRISGIETNPLVPLGFVLSSLIFVYLVLVRHFCDVNMLATSTLFDSLNVPLIILDSRKRITNMNELATRLFPGLDTELIGANAEVFLPEFSVLMEDLLRFGHTLHPEEDFIRVDEKAFQPRINPIIANGKVQGYLIWLEEVSLFYHYKELLDHEVSKQTLELQDNVNRMRIMRDQMVLGFSSISEHHDLSCKGHVRRTANYTEAIARQLYEDKVFPLQIDLPFVERIGQIAPLHDIGKTYIDRGILNKKSGLTPEEREIMESHTVMGAEFIDLTMKHCVDPLYAQMAHDVALSHHEWWDGSGYPDKLSGEQIPLSARIMAIADVYDALVTERPYKKPYTSQEAYDIIIQQKGTHFDPRVVDAFINCRSQIETIRRNVEDTNS